MHNVNIPQVISLFGHVIETSNQTTKKCSAMSQQIHLKRNTFVANEILERTQAENIDFAP